MYSTRRFKQSLYKLPLKINCHFHGTVPFLSHSKKLGYVPRFGNCSNCYLLPASPYPPWTHQVYAAALSLISMPFESLFHRLSDMGAASTHAHIKKWYYIKSSIKPSVTLDLLGSCSFSWPSNSHNTWLISRIMINHSLIIMQTCHMIRISHMFYGLLLIWDWYGRITFWYGFVLNIR